MFLTPSRVLINKLNHLSLVSSYCTQNVKWDILTAVCIERLPVITPKLTALQNKYKDHLIEIENEKSMKSSHEVRHDNDLAHIEMLKSNTSTDLDEVSKATAQDFEDASNDELSKFVMAPITSEADQKNNQKSLERDLQNHLVLLVEEQLGKDKMFILPQGKHTEGETLRQTAERILLEKCGDNVNVEIYGNAPYGFYKFKYPKETDGAFGAKVFFYYGRHRSGQITEDKKYKWLNRNELEKSLPENYFKSINKFLVEERQ